ncbi:hypothetical protein DV515_00008759 [Chloebia gouldiae]|uniref:Uncharacterized protein n=1 Tax=Chloebia gouldiae TaxID=44316 RepID=A0A3L8SDL7_CHLGU|nr:hypothetical protein DV515_00008759 [Chloebia gouldiae]
MPVPTRGTPVAPPGPAAPPPRSPRRPLRAAPAVAPPERITAGGASAAEPSRAGPGRARSTVPSGGAGPPLPPRPARVPQAGPSSIFSCIPAHVTRRAPVHPRGQARPPLTSGL